MADRHRSGGAGRHIQLPVVPGHVVALVGLSTAGYALALTGIASLQAATDQAAIADRAPAAGGLEAAAASNDRLAESFDTLVGRASSLAAGYGDLTAAIAGVETSLDALAGTVSAVDGASRALPASVALPPVVRTVRPGSHVTSHATTGGSAAP